MLVPNPQLHCKLFTTAYCGQIGWGWASGMWVSPLSLLLRQVLSPTLPSPCNFCSPLCSHLDSVQSQKKSLGYAEIEFRSSDMAMAFRKCASGWVYSRFSQGRANESKSVLATNIFVETCCAYTVFGWFFPELASQVGFGFEKN